MATWRRTPGELRSGLYDEILSKSLEAQLGALAHSHAIDREDVGESSDIDEHLANCLRQAMSLLLAANKKPSHKLELARAVLKFLDERSAGLFRPGETDLIGSILRSVLPKVQGAAMPTMARPRGSLLTSALITNAQQDSVLEHLLSEIASADRIDLLCSFIKLTGIEKFRSAIERHLLLKRPMRVLTTTYMQATDAKAVERLHALGAEVRVSYDASSTRLHAKSWLFHRDSGYSTAYVGSSNLSHAAQTEGLEWNVRIAEADHPDLLEQMKGLFGSYWADRDKFEPFDGSETQRTRLRQALDASYTQGNTVLLDVEPKDWQKPILRELSRARESGRHRNLIVAATGTGKTLMAAFDYADLRRAGRVDSLLVIAHHKEILEQTHSVFRQVLRLSRFGERWYEGNRPADFKHVFATIQSLSASEPFDPQQFDMIIVDEVHHSAAATYDQILSRVEPKELLGLTATPERADGRIYEKHFPQPYVGNLRVWDAIQQQILVPFRYYVVDVDGLDLSSVRWEAGGYVESELSGVLVRSAEAWTSAVRRTLDESVARPKDVRAIAFCVDQAHAREVARRLSDIGLKTRAITHETSRQDRTSAKSELQSGNLHVLATVDLFNEGVDIPDVNTLFFLRPTESATVFLQQLGRGLRRSPSKELLTVFDLTGRQHPKFRFDRHLRALLGHTPRELREYLETGSGRLPAGCHIHFEARAQQDILNRVRQAIPTSVRDIRRELQQPAARNWSLQTFLDQTEVDPLDLYRAGRSWGSLREDVHLCEIPPGPARDALARVQKLLHVTDDARLDAWQSLVGLEKPTDERSKRLAAMLFAILYGRFEAAAFDDVFTRWTSESILREEVAQLLPVLRGRKDLLRHPHVLDPNIPLSMHARYHGVELSVAFHAVTRDGEYREFYTGVERASDGKYDLILVTLDKSRVEKQHLAYMDYPINETLFHWQSKADTRQDDDQGQRHVRPRELGVTPLLFVRETNDDVRRLTAPFRYLGPVYPLKCSGERPISVEWQLEVPAPPEFVRHCTNVA